MKKILDSLFRLFRKKVEKYSEYIEYDPECIKRVLNTESIPDFFEQLEVYKLKVVKRIFK